MSIDCFVTRAIEDNKIELKEMDTIFFNANVEHYYTNETGKTIGCYCLVLKNFLYKL